MKFKSIVLLLILLFIPFIVNAKDKDIKITSVELVEKSEKAVELEKADFEDLEIYFRLKFFELKDNAKYKVKIINDSDIEYKINDNGQDFSDEKYMGYTIKYDNNSNIVAPHTEKTMYVTISYDKEVADEDYENNVYKNNNYMNLSFSTGKDFNPDTKVGQITIISIVLIVSLVLTIFFIRKRKSCYMIIVVLLMTPTIIKAMELFRIDINAYVEIGRRSIGTFSLCDENIEYQFEEGMTFAEWVLSDYNTSEYFNFEKYFGEIPTVEELYGKRVWFPYSAGWMDVPAEYDDQIIKGKFYNCYYGHAECVSPLSKIMITKDIDKLAKDVKENDSIVYYDTETKMLEIGRVNKVYIHKDATDFIRYTLEDGTYLEATDYHPIYTEDGWKSYTGRNGYDKPVIGDKVKTDNGWKKIIKIETYQGKEDFYDFAVLSKDGEQVDNYFANGILVHSAY